MEISTNTLTLAMYAVAEDLERTKARLAASADADEIDEEGQRVLDLQAAMSELGALYEQRRKANPDLAPAATWLPAEG